MYPRHKTLKERWVGAPTRGGADPSGHPSGAMLKTRALFREQLKGVVFGRDKNRFIVRRRKLRGTCGFEHSSLEATMGSRSGLSLTKAIAVGWR